MRNSLAMVVLAGLLFLSEVARIGAEIDSPYVRVDADREGFYLWFGADLKLGKHGLTLSHDIIYYPQTNEFGTEIGPVLSIAGGKLEIVPMAGILADLTHGKVEYMLPELYLYLTLDRFYFESWNYFYLGLTSETREQPSFYGRYFLRYSITKWLAVGPQVELTVDLSRTALTRLTSLPYGVSLGFGYGKGNTLDFFLGADGKDNNRFVSRVTFIHFF